MENQYPHLNFHASNLPPLQHAGVMPSQGGFFSPDGDARLNLPQGFNPRENQASPAPIQKQAGPRLNTFVGRDFNNNNNNNNSSFNDYDIGGNKNTYGVCLSAPIRARVADSRGQLHNGSGGLDTTSGGPNVLFHTGHSFASMEGKNGINQPIATPRAIRPNSSRKWKSAFVENEEWELPSNNTGELWSPNSRDAFMSHNQAQRHPSTSMGLQSPGYQSEVAQFPESRATSYNSDIPKDQVHVSSDCTRLSSLREGGELGGMRCGVNESWTGEMCGKPCHPGYACCTKHANVSEEGFVRPGIPHPSCSIPFEQDSRDGEIFISERHPNNSKFLKHISEEAIPPGDGNTQMHVAHSRYAPALSEAARSYNGRAWSYGSGNAYNAGLGNAYPQGVPVRDYERTQFNDYILALQQQI